MWQVKCVFVVARKRSTPWRHSFSVAGGDILPDNFTISISGASPQPSSFLGVLNRKVAKENVRRETGSSARALCLGLKCEKNKKNTCKPFKRSPHEPPTPYVYGTLQPPTTQMQNFVLENNTGINEKEGVLSSGGVRGGLLCFHALRGTIIRALKHIQNAKGHSKRTKHVHASLAGALVATDDDMFDGALQKQGGRSPRWNKQ